MNDNVTIEMPLHTHFDKPDKNERVYTKETVINAFDDERIKHLKKMYGGIPITSSFLKPDSFSENITEINPVDIIAIAKDINIENKSVSAIISDSCSNNLRNIILSEDISVGLRALGKIEKDGDINRVNVKSIICLDLIKDKKDK